MRIVRHNDIEEGCDYTLFFALKASPGAGYAFPCDAAGTVAVGKLPAASLANYAACLTDGAARFRAPVVQVYEWSRRVPAIGECACGTHVALEGWTIACPHCGSLYNSAGQELAPREQWGEETGETLADIETGREGRL